MYKIESGIVRPPKRGNLSKRYPFEKMGIGDSFKFNKDHVNRVSAAAFAFGRANSKKFSVRSNGSSARIWRVA